MSLHNKKSSTELKKSLEKNKFPRIVVSFYRYFEIKNVEDSQRTLLKGITCPNIVYPYLRANIADALQRASFPPVHLTEINWELFYQEKLKNFMKDNQSIIKRITCDLKDSEQIIKMIEEVVSANLTIDVLVKRIREKITFLPKAKHSSPRLVSTEKIKLDSLQIL